MKASFAQREEISQITMADAAPLSEGKRGSQTPKQKKENGCRLAGRGGNMTLCLVQCLRYPFDPLPYSI